MATFVVLDTGRPTEVEAKIGQDGVWITSADVKAALGWELRPEGFCRDDVCIPVAGHPDLVNDGAIHLEALADQLGRPIAISVDEGVAYLGSSSALFDQTIGMLEAPDFTLLDLGRQPPLAVGAPRVEGAVGGLGIVVRMPV